MGQIRHLIARTAAPLALAAFFLVRSGPATQPSTQPATPDPVPWVNPAEAPMWV